MCAIFEFKGKSYKPGQEITGFSAQGVVRLAWAGFARSEILNWWQKKGGVLIDIPATRFAERSEATGKLGWGDVPPGQVLRGLVDHQTEQPLIKIVTRASTADELTQYEHPRMPLLEPPLHLKEIPDSLGEPSDQELF